MYTTRRMFKINRLAFALSFVLEISYFRAKELILGSDAEVVNALSKSRRIRSIMENVQ